MVYRENIVFRAFEAEILVSFFFLVILFLLHKITLCLFSSSLSVVVNEDIDLSKNEGERWSKGLEFPFS